MYHRFGCVLCQVVCAASGTVVGVVASFQRKCVEFLTKYIAYNRSLLSLAGAARVPKVEGARIDSSYLHMLIPMIFGTLRPPPPRCCAKKYMCSEHVSLAVEKPRSVCCVREVT